MSHILTIDKDEKGNYFIAETNDEKLEVIAEVLLDKMLRVFLKEYLEDFSNLEDQYHEFPGCRNGATYHILKTGKRTFLIRKTAEIPPLQEQAQILEIDGTVDTFQDLIEKWEDLEQEKPQQIFLERTADTYTLTSSLDDL